MLLGREAGFTLTWSKSFHYRQGSGFPHLLPATSFCPSFMLVLAFVQPQQMDRVTDQKLAFIFTFLSRLAFSQANSLTL